MDAQSSMYLRWQQQILTSIPHVTGTLSLFGSVLILIIIWNDREAKLKRVYHRLLLGMSIIDVIRSINLALSSLVVPQNTPWVWNGQGTITTCEISGYINQFQVSIPLYTSFLCLYYVLIMIFQVRESTIAKRLEPFLHLVCWVYPMGAGVFGLVQGFYNPVDVSVGWCTIDDSPPNCSKSEAIECERGDNYVGFTVFSNIIPGIVAYTLITGSMVLILVRVRKVQGRMLSRYHESNAQELRKKQLFSDTVVQAGLYIGSSFLTYLWQTVILLSGKNSSDPSNRDFFFAFALLNKVFLPLTGFWNALIYMRPRFVALRRSNRDASMYEVISMIVYPSARFTAGTSDPGNAQHEAPIHHGQHRLHHHDHNDDYLPELSLHESMESEALETSSKTSLEDHIVPA